MNGIAFYGPPGAGKTTAARYLSSRYAFSPISFAGPLRVELVAALCSSSFMYSPDSCSECARRMRETHDTATKARYVPLLQAWGAFRRAEDPDYWVGTARRTLRRWTGAGIGGRAVVDDLRYDNEREMLLAEGVIPVLVDAPGRALKPAHESEMDWPNWPVECLVENRGTLEDFYRELDHAVALLTGRSPVG